MKTYKYTKEEVMQILEIARKMERLDSDLNKILKTGYVFVNFQRIEDLIYLHFRGETRNATDEKFSAPAYPDNKPIAWYQTIYNEPGKFTLSKHGYTGYMLDRIDELISFDEKIPNKTVYKHLKQIFKDLKKVEKDYAKNSI